VAIVRNGNTHTFYVNGVANGSPATVSYSAPAPQSNIYVGKSDLFAEYMNGYISNLRVVKGTAVYTANFTPPTSPLTAISGTSLLLLTDNYSIVNSTATSLPVTINTGASISTAQFPTGMSSSMLFNGTTGYVTVTGASTALAFGTGDFTIEFFVYLNATQTSFIYDGRPLSSTGNPPVIYLSNNALRYWSSSDKIFGGTLSNSTWTHIAVSRSGTSTKMFINGTQTGGTYTDSANYTGSNDRPIIGVEGTLANVFFINGYISNMRACKGTALYTSNFTPPSAPLSLSVIFPNYVTNNIYGVNQTP
jgi:hypothetical protein